MSEHRPKDDADHVVVSLEARARARKAPNAFRTISEVADDLHIPQHVLRFWETKFPQVKPLKRGGGRRYYRPDDIALLRRISGLLYIQGYTIKGVQRLLRESGGQLSDNIPPPAPDEKAGDTDIEADEPQLPMPGLVSPLALVEPHTLPRLRARGKDTEVPRDASRSQAAGSGQAADAEIARLRRVLHETLAELQALRAQFG